MFKVEFFRHWILNLNIFLSLEGSLSFLFILHLNRKILFSLEKIGKIDVEGLNVVLIDLEFSGFLLNFKLRSTIEDVSVVGKGLALEFENKLFPLVNVFRFETYFDLFFLHWF